MPKTQHTPGPWKLMTQPHRFVVISTVTHTTITEFIPWVDRAEKKADEANGALIAVAPELLAALRRLVSASYSYDNIPSVAGALREARAVIAKAEPEPEQTQEAENAKA